MVALNQGSFWKLLNRLDFPAKCLKLSLKQLQGYVQFTMNNDWANLIEIANHFQRFICSQFSVQLHQGQGKFKDLIIGVSHWVPIWIAGDIQRDPSMNVGLDGRILHSLQKKPLEQRQMIWEMHSLWNRDLVSIWAGLWTLVLGCRGKNSQEHLLISPNVEEQYNIFQNIFCPKNTKNIF